MKRTMKKHLLLISAVVILMTLFTFGTLAACEPGEHIYDAAMDEVIAPTCTEGGYTNMYCGVCGEQMGVKDRYPATGHRFDVKDYFYEEQDGGNYYYYKCECSNVNKGEDCKEITYKTDETTAQIIKFFTVTFVNPWKTASYDESVTYTSLAKTYEDKQLGVIYVAEGEAATYSGSRPYREKDNHPRTADDGSTIYGYGAYSFTGWNAQKPGSSPFGPAADPAALENIKKNTTLYATFEGAIVHYTVVFVDGDGKQISDYITVTHGAKDSKILSLFENNPPQRKTTSLYRYEFREWDRDITAFFGDCTVKPLFNAVEKEYTYVYHGADGKEFFRENLTCSSTPHKFTSEEKSGYIAKPDDKKYIYNWTGNWCWENNTVHTLNIPTTVPSSINEGDEIHVYPVYNQKLIEYDLLVRVRFLEENPYYSLDEFIVQVKDANGQLRASGMTNEQGEFLCKVNYSDIMYVTVMSEDNRCSGETSLAILYRDYPTVANITLDAKASIDNPAYNCGCICHNSLIRPIWVRVLNILYNLFKIKFVCCDDMYASIGDLLVYTQQS